MEEDDERLLAIQREYEDFLDDGKKRAIYSRAIKTLINKKIKRLIVNIDDIKDNHAKRFRSLLLNGFEEQYVFTRALRRQVSIKDPVFAKMHEEIYVGFEGDFGQNHVSLRNLNSEHLGCMVCVEGVVNNVSLVMSKVVRSVHYCPANKRYMERRYTDLTSFSVMPSNTAYPTKDDDGNLLETEFGLSRYLPHQVVTLQEMPEKAFIGRVPRDVEIICDDDMVDQCKPGDRIQVVGNYIALPSKSRNTKSNTSFKCIIIANNISHLHKETNYAFSVEDVRACRNLAKKRNILEILANSVAPSIYGHMFVKKAIVCQLLGGQEKHLPNGSRLRGDINLLLIGDPSVAKSQLLRYVLSLAPRAICATGRCASGPGLTAAIVNDRDTHERRLEAGAMVLADRGIVCIDEFDKMNDIDRSAIHEAMEQGRVTITKGGVHASLNARCSVLAAANPVYGRYNQYKTPMENIGLQDSLLSRFDLLFVMLDVIDPNDDTNITEHILNMHQYRHPDEMEGEVLPMTVTQGAELEFGTKSERTKKTSMYDMYVTELHGKNRGKPKKVLSVEFLRKYIRMAKCVKPVLSADASDMIASEFCRLRSEKSEDRDVARTQPVTPRTLESLIRLSTAHARARLSGTVTPADAQAAIELVQYSYFKKVLDKGNKKRQRHDKDSDDESEMELEENESEPRATPGARKSKRTRTNASDEITVPEFESRLLEPISESADPNKSQDRSAKSTTTSTGDSAAPSTSSLVKLSEERLQTFRLHLQKFFRENREQSSSVERVSAYVNENVSEKFSENEIYSALSLMTDANQILLADDIVFLI